VGWFKVDDQLAFHRKTLAAGNAAMGLWVRSGSWLRNPGNGRGRPPGVLLVSEARTMGTAAEVKKLLDAGLWAKTTLDGAKAVRFHDWEIMQPDQDELSEKRTAWAAQKKRRRHHLADDHSLCLPDQCDHAPPPPPDDDGEEPWGVRSV
jgi:hypothetical protein